MEQILKTAELITDFMQTQKLSKTAFCKLCKIGNNTLNRLLSNDNVRLRILYKVARVLNIKVTKFFIDV